MVFSPFKYINQSENTPVNVLDSVLFTELNFRAHNSDLPVILTLNHLTKHTRIGYRDLRHLVVSSEYGYTMFKIKKRSGGTRDIYIPNFKLKTVQKWINQHILSNMKSHPSSFAFNKGSSILKCASRHTGAKWLIKLDIENFFESISEIKVNRVFRSFGYSPLVSFELSRLCTVVSENIGDDEEFRIFRLNSVIPDYTKIGRLGFLPQGAPTSPLLSNLVMLQLDDMLTKIAIKNGLTYTRYSDDITFSSRDLAFGRRNAFNIIKLTYAKLKKFGFTPQYKKTHVISPGARKIVLGLNVDNEDVKLQKKFKNNVELHLFFCKKYGAESHRIKRKFHNIYSMQRHILGLINYAKMIEPDYAKKLFKDYKEIIWE